MGQFKLKLQTFQNYSFMEEDDDLRFLDDLGSKFKTLAEVCSGGKMAAMKTETVRRNVSFPDLLERGEGSVSAAATSLGRVASMSNTVCDGCIKYHKDGGLTKFSRLMHQGFILNIQQRNSIQRQ